MARATRTTVGAQARSVRVADVIPFPGRGPHADNGGGMMDYVKSDAPRTARNAKKSRALRARTTVLPRAAAQLILPAPGFARVAPGGGAVSGEVLAREVMRELYGVRWKAHCLLGQLESAKDSASILELHVRALCDRDRELSSMLEVLAPDQLAEFNRSTDHWRTSSCSSSAYVRARSSVGNGGDSCA